MRKLYSKIIILVLVVIIYGISAVKGQACGNGAPFCSVVSQNFNSGSGGFTSSSPLFALTSGADPDFRVLASEQGTEYSLISPVYTLLTGTAYIGFDLTGTSTVGIVSFRVSILNNAGTSEIAGATIIGNCSSICQQFPGLTQGTEVRYRITITTAGDPSGDNSLIVVDDFSNGGIAQAPLPVDLKSFNAKRNSTNTVVLNWETASESNVRGFEIQRKSTTGTFEKIGFVFSKSVNGNSATPLQYSFNDINNNSSASQYRIVSVDLDGRTKISLIRSVDGLKGLAKILVYPNPSSSGPVNVVFPDSDPRDIQLTDLVGRLHSSWKSYKNQDLVINKLIPGSYMLRITNIVTNKKEVIRLSVTK